VERSDTVRPSLSGGGPDNLLEHGEAARVGERTGDCLELIFGQQVFRLDLLVGIGLCT
jgi:hypothetical protein